MYYTYTVSTCIIITLYLHVLYLHCIYMYYTYTVSTKNDHINVSNYYMYYKVGT